jgi:argininosuccinate lyase
MHATYRAAILKDDLLALADQLNQTSETLVKLAEQHAKTIVPSYTNGVAAQPNSYGHYLLGHAAGFERDAQRIREAYARIDRSAAISRGALIDVRQYQAEERHAAHDHLPRQG